MNINNETLYVCSNAEEFALAKEGAKLIEVDSGRRVIRFHDITTKQSLHLEALCLRSDCVSYEGTNIVRIIRATWSHYYGGIQFAHDANRLLRLGAQVVYQEFIDWGGSDYSQLGTSDRFEIRHYSREGWPHPDNLSAFFSTSEHALLAVENSRSDGRVRCLFRLPCAKAIANGLKGVASVDVGERLFSVSLPVRDPASWDFAPRGKLWDGVSLISIKRLNSTCAALEAAGFSLQFKPKMGVA